MDSPTKYHTLPDGRTLAYCEFGDPDGDPLFYTHGSPGSRLEGELFHEAAVQAGFRLIPVDRPGFGKSTYQPNRPLLDFPQDIQFLANALGIERFGVMGWSGGGAHAVSCAYALPERLTVCLSLAGYTNFAELPGAASMLRLKVDQYAVRLAQHNSRLFPIMFWLMALNVRYLPNLFYKSFAHAVPPPDQAILAEPSFKEHFIADQQEAFRGGHRGTVTDAVLHYHDWGFRLQEITQKVLIMHGTDDYNVPLAYSEHLAEQIPNCELHRLNAEGHLFPAKMQTQIFELLRAEVDNKPTQPYTQGS